MINFNKTQSNSTEPCHEQTRKATESNNVEKHQTEERFKLDFRYSLESDQPSSFGGE